MLAMANDMTAQQLDAGFRKDIRTNKTDSVLKLNEDAIKLIKFDFMPKMENEIKPLENPLEKPWMKFRTGITAPRSLTDTTKTNEPTGYIRMLPYSIWTAFGEDPFYDIMTFGWKIGYTFNPSANYSENFGANTPPSAGRMSDGMRIHGAGITIGGLDFIGFIYNNLTPRGRMLQHNRKHANAWKTYQKYLPTLADNMKFPTFYNGPAPYASGYSASKDTAYAQPFHALTDSMRAEIETAITSKRETMRKEYLEKSNDEADKNRKPDRVKGNSGRDVKEAKAAKQQKDKEDELRENEQKIVDELSGSMDSIYIYMRRKEERKAQERAEQKRNGTIRRKSGEFRE